MLTIYAVLTRITLALHGGPEVDEAGAGVVEWLMMAAVAVAFGIFLGPALVDLGKKMIDAIGSALGV